MNRDEIRERARFLCDDELQYALAREEKVDTNAVRERATMRLTREITESEMYELARGLIDGLYRRVERSYIVDLGGQLGFSTAIRIDDNTLVPTPKARLRDWLAYEVIVDNAFVAHAEAWRKRKDAIAAILNRLGGRDDDTTLDACPDLFGEAAA